MTKVPTSGDSSTTASSKTSSIKGASPIHSAPVTRVQRAVKHAKLKSQSSRDFGAKDSKCSDDTRSTKSGSSAKTTKSTKTINTTKTTSTVKAAKTTTTKSSTGENKIKVLQAPKKLADYYDFRGLAGGTFGSIASCADLSCLSGIVDVASVANGKEYCGKEIVKKELDDKAVYRRIMEYIMSKDPSGQNIVKIHSMFESDSSFYQVMPKSSGNLAKLITFGNKRKYENSPPTLKGSTILEFTRQILGGLHFLHRYSILHRDIRPENVLVEDNGELMTGADVNEMNLKLKIMDFSRCIKMENGAQSFHDTNFKVFKDNSAMFTAPEVFETQVYTRSTDMFSIGVLLHFLITEKDPCPMMWEEMYEDHTKAKMKMRQRMLTWVKSAKSKMDNEDWQRVGSDGIEAVQRALHVNPEDRFTSTNEMLHSPWLNKPTKTTKAQMGSPKMHPVRVQYYGSEAMTSSSKCAAVCDIRVEFALKNKTLAPDVQMWDSQDNELINDELSCPNDVVIEVQPLERDLVYYMHAMKLHAAARHESGVKPVLEEFSKDKSIQATCSFKMMGKVLLLSLLESFGGYRLAERLVLAKANLTVTTSSNKNVSILRVALSEQLPQIVQLLVKNKADVEDKTGLGTPLHVALSKNDNESFTALVRGKADINAKNEMHFAPLHVAVRNGNLSAVKSLLKMQADANRKTGSSDNPSGLHTPLHIAAMIGEESKAMDIIKVLVAAKADLTIKNMMQNNPFHIACGKENVGVVQLLLSLKADVNVPNDVDLPIHIAARESSDVLKVLIKHTPTVHIKNRMSNTPLHSAAWHGSVDAISLLIAAKASVNARNKDGCTALHYAAMRKKALIIPLLTGAHTAAKNEDGQTASDLTDSALCIQCIQDLEANNMAKSAAKSASAPRMKYTEKPVMMKAERPVAVAINKLNKVK